jgi:hypothetical protein
MTRYNRDVQFLVILSVKLVQPGLLGDIAEGVGRISTPSQERDLAKAEVAWYLQRLRELDFVRLYAGRRYMLTDAGEAYVAHTGIKLKIDARRMFLLKETRRSMFR